MTNLNKILYGLVTQLKHELNLPIIASLSALDFLQANSEKIPDSEKIKIVNILQVHLEEISCSLDETIEILIKEYLQDSENKMGISSQDADKKKEMENHEND